MTTNIQTESKQMERLAEQISVIGSKFSQLNKTIETMSELSISIDPQMEVSLGRIITQLEKVNQSLASSDATGFAGAMSSALESMRGFNTGFDFIDNIKEKAEDFGGFSKILDTIKAKSSTCLGGMGQSFETLNGRMNGFGIGMTRMSTVMTALTSPVGIFLSALTLLAGVFAYLMNTNEGFRESVMDLFSQISAAVGPFIIDIMASAQKLVPIIEIILQHVISAVNTMITVISPIVAFVAGIVVAIVALFSQCGGKVGEIFTKIFGVIEQLFPRLTATVTKVISTVKNAFNAIKSSWNGLGSFVNGIRDGLNNAFNNLANRFRRTFNNAFQKINIAIGVINMIPGVSISRIAQLYHGTDNWQGGFAYMNEGGRGELTYLPNGAQVIPHDISVKYAKEAARANAGGAVAAIDYDYLINGLARAMSNVQVKHTSVLNGREVAKQVTPLVDRNLGSMRRLAERGVY